MPKSMPPWSPHHRLIIREAPGSEWVFLITAMLLAWAHVGGQAAHADPGRVQIGANLAPSWETHNGERPNLKNTYKQGVSAGAGVRYGVSDSLAVETEFLYATRGTGIEYQGESLGGLYFTYLELPVLVRLGWTIPGLTDADGRRPLTGYVTAGPAVSYVLGAEDVLTDGTTRTISRSMMNSFDVGAAGGIGVVWDITPRWAASLEVRYEQGFIDTLPSAENGLETKNRAFLLILGIDYTVNDRDADGDGVADSRDQCMTQSEDRNGYQDSDGCPDGDDDRDGVVAGLDECPLQAEDHDQWEDEDGCPDADNDGDGLLDAEDMCPTKAFSYNRKLEHARRGCPPRPSQVRIEGDELVLDPALVFGELESTLTAEQMLALDQVAVLLLSYYPRMVLRVEGHADGEGDKQKNVERSERRAKVVADYLIAKGIKPERLVEKGYGEERPIRREEGVRSRPENRRVELVIIELEVDLEQK